MNVFQASLDNYDPKKPLAGMDGTTPEGSVDLDTLSPTLVNGTFCFRLTSDRTTPFTYSEGERHRCRLRTLVLPRNMYRIKNVTPEGQKDMAETPLLTVAEADEDGHTIESGEVLLVDVYEDGDIPDDPVYHSSFAKIHPCAYGTVPDIADLPAGATPVMAQLLSMAGGYGTSGGGGNPCCKLTLAYGPDGSRTYLAVMWDWEKTYGRHDPKRKAKNNRTHLETVFAELKKELKNSPVPLLATDGPDGSIVWLTLPTKSKKHLEKLDAILQETVIENVDFPVPSPYFFDGPDVAVSKSFGKDVYDQLQNLTNN
ncbi:hypothetical protein [Lewinella sp. IMCC34191]|uniref:hypothetical protein n=1 Tax=Lewinella sp. IMCC34191 TaxID=2259172 RepID=UPI000E25FA99|nr:hypothetical protein [Lewinella sp. IMCC34191]